MSNYLAVDTASRHLTVIVKNGDKIYKSFVPECAMRHSVILQGEIDKTLKNAGISPNECDFFAAVTGPGSFTGIRIGIAVVKGLAFATEKKLLGVTSLEAVAYNVKSAKFFAAVDAAHSHYYVSLCENGEVGEPEYLSEEEINSCGLPVYGFEDLKLNNYTRLGAEDLLPVAISKCEGRLSDELDAVYVRKSQAEEGRK